MKKQTKSIVQLPIHFKSPGRSYSQIGRKGNVALYAVYSDYATLFTVLPYVLLGYELVVIKTNPNGHERYPRNEEFGASGWSIPKSFLATCRTCLGRCFRGWTELCISEPFSVLNRSTSSADCTCQALAPA